jgi:hypothetical protein
MAGHSLTGSTCGKNENHVTIGHYLEFLEFFSTRRHMPLLKIPDNDPPSSQRFRFKRRCEPSLSSKGRRKTEPARSNSLKPSSPNSDRPHYSHSQFSIQLSSKRFFRSDRLVCEGRFHCNRLNDALCVSWLIHRDSRTIANLQAVIPTQTLEGKMETWISEVGGVILRIELDLERRCALASARKRGSDEFFYNIELSLEELNRSMLMWDDIGECLTIVPLKPSQHPLVISVVAA